MQALCYIDGRWVEGDSTFSVTDPATGKAIGTASEASASMATEAIDAASQALPVWSALPAKDRSNILRKIAEHLLDAVDRIADVVVAEQGKTASQAAFEVKYAAEWITWFAEEGRRTYGRVIPTHSPAKRLMVLRQPVGIAVAITPWNFPVAMIARKLAPALAAGCTMVVKPAEQTPLSAAALFEILDEAGLPPGVANCVTTSDPVAISPHLLQDPRVRKITFTGSTEVGKLLVRESGNNLTRVSLELGGHAPFIVFEDADLEAAVTGLLTSKFQVTGQSCLCPNRIFVHEEVEEEFIALLTAAVSSLVVGPGSKSGVDIGPLIDRQTFEKVQGHVDDAVAQGASVTVGGSRVEGAGFDDGFFFAPTIIQHCTDTMKITTEETFGPVVPLMSFSTDEDVLARANDTQYGLAAYFYTNDLRRSLRVAERLEYGMVGVNDPTPATPSGPFGGMKESGLGREGGFEGIDAFLESKLISTVI